jgi:hypothetical protein
MATHHLANYLNNHLAGSEVAFEMLDHLERRYARTPLAKFTVELRSKIEADQKELKALMARDQVAESRPRQAATCLAESFTELKLRLDDPSGGGHIGPLHADPVRALYLLPGGRGSAPAEEGLDERSGPGQRSIAGRLPLPRILEKSMTDVDTAARLLDALVAIFPAFRAEWEPGEDPTTFHEVILRFTPFFGPQATTAAPRELGRLGELINACVTSDGPLSNAVATCLLEHLHQIGAWRALKAHLSEQARRLSRA